MDIIYDEGRWAEAVKAVDMMREAMPGDLEGAAKYKFWSGEEAAEKFYCRGEEPVGAVTYEAGSLSAYKFVIGVLKMCLRKGLSLWTNTPVLKVEKESGEDEVWRVQTDTGVVRTKKVILATNGYSAFLAERFRGVIVPLRGQITAHRPGSNMPANGLGLTYSFVYANGFEYMIPRPQGSKFAGDIVMGGGLVKAPNEGLEEYGTTDDTTLNPVVGEYLKGTTARYFGNAWGKDHIDGRIRKEWTGIMGYSSDGYPFVGEVPGEKGLWMTASFQGHGMVLCFLCAQALVAMIEGGKKELELESWFPGVFKVTEDRMRKRFNGILHTRATEVEIKARL